jgi:hypothetical protein
MNKTVSIALLVVLSLVGGVIGAKVLAPLIGGDFAGGIVPSNLWTGNAASNYVNPVGTFAVAAPGGFYFGGTAANNQVPTVYTAVGTYPWTPSSTSAITISSLASASSSATTTSLSFTAPGFSVGDPCEVQYTGSTSTLITSANVTAVSGSAVTSTATFLNVSGSSVTLYATSTVTGVTSTIKLTCIATGV